MKFQKVQYKKFKRMDKYSDAELIEFKKDHNVLASKLYGGNNKGIDYRGRGIIQTTTEVNYKNAQKIYNKMFGTNYNFIENPNLLANNQIAVRTSLIFFYINIFNGKRTINSIDDVSKIINYHDTETFPSRKNYLIRFIIK